MIPITGFAPDANPTSPGVLVDCGNLIPFEGGFKGAPALVSVGADALAAACRGAASVTKLDGTKRVFAGSATELYELQSNLTWSSVKHAAGAYSLGTDDRWAFTQIGNATIVATPSNALQSSSSGAFADISGAPSAKLVESSQGFVVAFNTSTNSDEWYCSAYLDEEDWTLDVTKQCVKGRLVSGSGPITAARRFGDDIVAYKAGSMFVGRYVGAPEVWRWDQVSTDVGCVGQDAVVDTSIGHVFVGRDNVYVFDGTAPLPLATGIVRDWLMNALAGTYSFATQLLWDRARNLVWIYYVPAGGTLVSRCLVYHIGMRQWGVANDTIEAVMQYTAPSGTYDGGYPGIVTQGSTTYAAAPTNISYDSLLWVSGQTNPAVFDSSHKLSTLSGACASAYFMTGDLGDEFADSFMTNFWVRYTQNPSTTSVVGYTKTAAGSTPVQASSSTGTADGRHNVRQTARWHRFLISTTGDFEATAFQPQMTVAGRR